RRHRLWPAGQGDGGFPLADPGIRRHLPAQPGRRRALAQVPAAAGAVEEGLFSQGAPPQGVPGVRPPARGGSLACLLGPPLPAPHLPAVGLSGPLGMRTMLTKRPKVAVAVNIIAPYRKPLYEALGREFDVTVFCTGQEGNRKDWGNVAAGLTGVTVKQSWGMTLEVARRGDRGQVPDRRYLHATPGLLADLVRFDRDGVITSEMGARPCVALAYGTWHRKPVWIWGGGTRHTEKHIGRLRKVVRGLISRWGKRWFSYGQTSTEYLRTLGIP